MVLQERLTCPGLREEQTVRWKATRCCCCFRLSSILSEPPDHQILHKPTELRFKRLKIEKKNVFVYLVEVKSTTSAFDMPDTSIAQYKYVVCILYTVYTCCVCPMCFHLAEVYLSKPQRLMREVNSESMDFSENFHLFRTIHGRS